MFYIKKLRRDILLGASYLGPNLKESVKRRVIEELEGTCLGR
jgi:DNA-directed RNA polymerase subunit E'/Rpb7